MMLVDIKRFENGLCALAELRRSGALRLIAGVPGVVATKIELLEGGDQGEHFQRKLDSAKLKRAEFDEIVAEVADVLEVILSGRDVEELAKSVGVDAEAQATTEDRIRTKVDLVRREFGTDIRALKDRTWVKTTAKTEIINSVSWDVSLKHGTDTDDEAHKPAVPFAVLQVTAIPPIEFGTLKERTMTVTLDGEDIQYLLDSLERLYAAFLRLSEHTD